MMSTEFKDRLHTQWSNRLKRDLAATDDECIRVIEPLLNPKDDPQPYIKTAKLIRGDDTDDALFKDCAESFALVYCEHFEGFTYTSLTGSTEDTEPLVKSLEGILMGLVSREKLGFNLASSQVCAALCSLADSLKQVACKCILGQVPSDSDDGKLFGMMRSQPALGAKLCGILIPAAKRSASYPVGMDIIKSKQAESSPQKRAGEKQAGEKQADEKQAGEKQADEKQPFGDGARNIAFACRALVFACYWLVHVVEGLTHKSGGASKVHTEVRQETEKKVQEKLCPFVSQASTEWSAVKMAWGTSGAPCDASLEDSLFEPNSPYHRQALKSLCANYSLWPDQRWDPEEAANSAERFMQLFETTRVILGLACWEIFGTLHISQHGGTDFKERKLEEVVGYLVGHINDAIKGLLDCCLRCSKWGERLGDLADRLRKVAEKLIEAAYIHELYQKPEDVLNKSKEALAWTDMAKRLKTHLPGNKKEGSVKEEARCLAALFTRAQAHCSHAGVHSENPTGQARQHAQNLGNNIIIGCRSVMFSSVWLARLINAEPGRDTRQPDQAQLFSKWQMDLYLEHQPHKNHILSSENLVKNFKALFQQACAGERNIHHANSLANQLKRELQEKHDPGSQQERNAINAMKEEFKFAVGYIEKSIHHSSVWLQRILTGEDDHQYSSVLAKLQQRADDLLELYARKPHMIEAHEKLRAFKQELSKMEHQSRELKDARKEIRRYLLDDCGQLGSFAGLITKLNGDELQDDGIEKNEVLDQAVAFVQAMQDKGCHRDVDNPDILVLWHREEGLEKNNTACYQFVCHLKAKLVVPKSVLQEVKESLKVAKQQLKQRLVCRDNSEAPDSDFDEDEAPVFIRDVNRVFERRVSVPAAIKNCLDWVPPSQERETPLLIRRERDIAAAVEVLTSSAEKRHLLLTGQGGIGKSTLGQNIKEELQAKGHLAGTFEMDLLRAQTPETVLEELCSGFCISGKVKEVADVKTEVLTRVRLRLRNCREGQGNPSLLLLLDSCELSLRDPEAAGTLAEVLLHVMRCEPRVRVLVAARGFVHPSSCSAQCARLALQLWEQLYELPVDKLDLESAKAILRKGFGNSEPEHEPYAEAVAKLCDCIPLHLSLAASILSFSGDGYKGIQHMLEAAAKQGTKIEAALLRGHKREHLEALLSLSMFATLFSTRQAERMLSDPAADVPILLQILYGHRLLLAVPSASSETLWRLHPDVREAMQQLPCAGSLQQQQEKQQQQRFQEIVASARVRFAECMLADLAKCARSSPREVTRAVLEQQANFIEALAPSDPAISKAVAQVLLEEWESFVSRKDWISSIGRVSALLLPSLQVLCQALEDALASSCKKAQLQRRGRAVLQLSQLPQPMDISELVLLYAGALSLQADLMVEMAQYDKAAELRRKLLGLLCRVQGPEHLFTITSMSKLAGTLLYQNNLEEAEGMQREVLEQGIRMLGPEDPHTLTSWNNLALILRQQGSLVEAEGILRMVLVHQRSALGPTDPETLSSMSNLAYTLQRPDKLEEAECIQREVLKQSSRVLGLKHPETLIAMNNLAVTLSQQHNKLEEAELKQREVLELRRKVLGPGHLKILDSMNNLVRTLLQQNKLGAAEGRQRKVLKWCQEVLGPEDPETLTSMDNLARTLFQRCKYAASAELCCAWMEKQGPGHPEAPNVARCLKTTLHHWATKSRKLGASEAPFFLSAALVTCEHVPEPSFPVPWHECVGQWCKLLHDSGAWAEAHKLAKRAYECCCDKLGKKDRDSQRCKKLVDKYPS